MKFYNREEELIALNKIYDQCKKSYGKITVLTGRRRIGKTLLAKKYAENKEFVYLFISKKAEHMLCNEFLREYESFTQENYIGSITSFVELFELFLKKGREKEFVLIIDEFQEFKSINPGVFSEIQKLWDTYKFETHIHIIFIGSIYSLMTEIFQNEKEPLYGRADKIMYLKPFNPSVIKEILQDNNCYSNENVFYNFLITGGVPRYLEILQENQCFKKEEILDLLLEKDSFFIQEGKTLLIQEFGKDYGMYFSILELIASGQTSRSEIENTLHKSIGGYLERLENEYDIITKVKPIGAKKDSRNQKYTIKDNFIKFWFRFIYKHMTLVQSERFAYIAQLIDRDLSTYAGPILEKLFIDILNTSTKYGLIGTYWEKGNLNEIDIVAINDIDKELYFAEVKLNKDKISIHKLQEKSEKITKKYPSYKTTYEGLTIEDIADKIEAIPYGISV